MRAARRLPGHSRYAHLITLRGWTAYDRRSVGGNVQGAGVDGGEEVGVAGDSHRTEHCIDHPVVAAADVYRAVEGDDLIHVPVDGDVAGVPANSVVVSV